MTDLHRLPAEREPAFWEGQRAIHERCPVYVPAPAARFTIRPLVLAAVIAGGALLWWGAARAAERNQSWDVFAFREGRLLQADAANIVPVESKGPFSTLRECKDIGIQTVRIRDAGWRLSCRRVDQ